MYFAEYNGRHLDKFINFDTQLFVHDVEAPAMVGMRLG